MQARDAVTYHSSRATRELDLGLTAGSTPVARAHLQLASMHMQRVRELTGIPNPAPLLIID